MSRRRRRKHRPSPRDLLWSALCERFQHWKFRRDMIVGPYVVDFLSLERLVIIEIERERQPDPWAGDRIRLDYLQGWGYRVLRLPEAEIVRNIERALQDMHGSGVE